MSDLKRKAINGVFWSATEKFSGQGLRFVLGIILARLLTPKDYGLVGMLAIFIAISQAFVMSGFGAALIQKKDRDEKDFSTTFYYNIVVALLFYILLFILAPYIANFYNEPLLVDLTRAISFTIVIEAFAVVQRAKFTINIDFKSQTKASIISVIISGLLGITLAYKGFGVWALVAQILTRGFINVIILWIISKWIPKEGFSFIRFKRLFSYGSKLLLAGIMHSIAQNISKIIIGKTFATQTLGFYTRANQFAQFPSVNINSIISRVTFPILCEFQNDESKLEEMFQKIIKSTAILIFPLMALLVALAEPLIITLLTEKWKDSIALMQIICIGLMFLPINSLNVQIFGVVGRTDLVLKTDIVKQFLLIGFLLGTSSFGIKAIVVGQSVAYLLTYFINLIIIQKVMNYKILKQITNLLPIFIFSIILGGVVFLTSTLFISQSLKLILSGGIGVLIYFLVIWKLNIAETRTLLVAFFKNKNN